jgi:hypothetical protein
MNRIAIAALLLGSAPAWAQQAPFCATDNVGNRQCFYYDAQSCQRAAVSLGGICTANDREPAKPQRQGFYDVAGAIQHPDMAGSMQRGMQAGALLRQQEQEHRARPALLQAQTEAARGQRQEINGQAVGYWIMFRCPTPSGSWEYTGTPTAGCVVETVVPY